MTGQSFFHRTMACFPILTVLALAVMMVGCVAGPPPGTVVGSSVAVSTGGDFGVAFGTGFGYAPVSPEQRELMERRSRFHDLAYDDYPYDWYW